MIGIQNNIFQSVIDIVSIAIATPSLILALISLWVTRISRKEFGNIEALLNIQPILIHRYSERPLKTPYNYNGNKIILLRELRNLIYNDYNLKTANPLVTLKKYHKKSIQQINLHTNYP